MKVTRDHLINATSYFYGSKLVKYTDLLASNTGVKIGEEIALDVVGDIAFNPINVVYSEDDLVIEVEEFENYVAARFEDDEDETVYFFALEEIEE